MPGRAMVDSRSALILAFTALVGAQQVLGASFFDDFNRPDSPTVGNGWLNVTTGLPPLQIINDEVTQSLLQGGRSAIFRPFDSSDLLTASATIKETSGYGGLARRYDAALAFHSDGTIGSGYGIYISRSDENNSNSTVSLFDGATTIATVTSSVQFGPSIDVRLTERVDGRVSGQINSGSGTFTFSFGARSVQSSGGNFIYWQGSPDTRTSNPIFHRLDDVSLNSTPDYKQYTGGWENQLTLNDSNPTNRLHKTGCFVTSAAMIADAFGHTVTPGAFNTYLSSRTNTDGNFPWASSFPVSSTLGAGDVGGPALSFHSGSALISGKAPLDPAAGREQVIDALRTRIDTYGPLLLRVPSTATGGLAAYNAPTPGVHAIVAYAVQGDSVLIRDPGHDYGTDSYTLDDYITHFNSGKSSTSELHNADGSVGGLDYSWLRSKPVGYATVPSAPSIAGAAHSPIDFVITDPLGRRLGHDPTTDAYYNEIPDSSYGREEIAVPEDDLNAVNVETGYGELLYEIGAPTIGAYSVQVFGLAGGHWSLDGGIDGNPLFSFSGEAQAGSSESATFSVSSIPEPNIVTLVLLGPLFSGRRRTRRHGFLCHL